MRTLAFALGLCMLVSTTAVARPHLGLRYHKVGKNLIIENPEVVRHKNGADDWDAMLKLGPAGLSGQSASAAMHKPEGVGDAGMAMPDGAAKTLLPLVTPETIDGFQETFSDRVTEQLRPGHWVARHFSTGTGTFVPAEDEGFPALTADAWAAVDLAPDWIRIELISNLCHLTAAQQDTLASLMLNVEDPLWLDEIAFLLANTAPEDLTYEQFRPGYLVDQVRFLYMADPLLDYVQLKEVGTPGEGDYWTTAVYKYTDAEGDDPPEVKEWELPREYYYWWIVHSRLDGEELVDIDPAKGQWAPYPGAVTFKDFYAFNPDTVEDYMLHYIFRKAPPYEKYKGMEAIPPASLEGWKPASRGFFPEWKEISPMFLTFDSEGRVTTMEFKVRPKGIVLATTLQVEKAYADGKSELLRNMLRYGAGNVVMRNDWKHVVIMERAPFGHDGVIESVLNDWKVTYEIVDSTWLATADLSDVHKIIVPSDQPLAVYQALADNRDALQAWLSADWRILELHGAVTQEEDDWSGLVMPGGFTYDFSDAGDDVIEVEGQPPLMKYMADTKTVWDKKQYPGLSGDRPCDPDTFAMDKIGWWSSQNVFDSAVDYGEKHSWLIMPERSSYSVRVLYNHYGNCGENQDVITSASRSCLVPTANTSNGPEDHVWSEFFLMDSWHTYQMGWADAPTDIDTPGISSGKKWGGGKNNSFITSARGDGALVNRTDYYHYTGKINISVVDAAGDPIKGAEVLIATETFYKQNGAYPLTIGFWDITDENGKLVIEAGANVEEDLSQCKNPEIELRCNNYYVKVVTSAGNYPPEDNKVSLIVEDIEAGKGFEKNVDIVIDGVPTVHRAGGTVDYAEADPTRVLKLDVHLLEELRCGFGLWAGEYCDHNGPGVVDFFILDHTSFVNFFNGEPFDALVSAENIDSDYELLVNAPPFGDWYFVVVNNGRFQFEQLFDATISVLEGEPPLVNPEPTDTEDVVEHPPIVDVSTQDGTGPSADAGPDAAADEDASSGSTSGCSTGTVPSQTAGAMALILLTAMAVGLSRRPRQAMCRPPINAAASSGPSSRLPVSHFGSTR